MVHYKEADNKDFAAAFDFIQKLWDYNTYDLDETKKVYESIVEDENSFAFFLIKDDKYIGFCHGVFFRTFWMSGNTCYVSSVIVNEEYRGNGYAKFLLDHAREKAIERNCKGMVLDSGFPRENAHHCYEKYGFSKNCYGFDLIFEES